MNESIWNALRELLREHAVTIGGFGDFATR